MTFYGNGLRTNINCTAGSPCTPQVGANYNNIINLVQQEQALIVTYYPVREGYATTDPYRAMAPTQVTTDFNDLMSMEAAFSPSQRAIIVQEIGYPSSDSVRYNTAQSGQEYQRQFVANLFTAWKPNAQLMKAVLWWSLFDYGDITGNQNDATCNALATLWNQQTNLRFKQAFCTMGLIKPNPASQGFAATAWTEKTAMGVFRQQGPGVQTY